MGMEARGIPGGPIHTLDQAFTSDQAQAREMVVTMQHPASGGEVRLIGNPLKLSATPVTYRFAPPACNADEDSIRKELREGGP